MALVGGCATGGKDLQSRVTRQEQQIQQLNAQLSGVQPAQADTWSQLQTMRQEISTLRGQIEDFNNATANMGGLAGMARRVEQQHAALQALEAQFGLQLNLDAAPAGAVPGAPGAAPGVPQPNAGSNAGGVAPGGVTLPPPQSSEPVQINRAQTTTQDAQKDTATALYDAGIEAFNKRNYKGALNSFRDFTEMYPTHKLVSNGWFWRGEAEFALGNYSDAALDYEQVISKYPSSGKAASAYLKQGMSFMRANKKDAAKLRLNELVKKFPQSAEAARAKQLLKEIK